MNALPMYCELQGDLELQGDEQLPVCILLKNNILLNTYLLTYGTETWAIKAENWHSLERAYDGEVNV